MNKNLRIFILSLAALLSLSACRDYDLDYSKTEHRDHAIGAYMGLTISTASKNNRTTRSGGASNEGHVPSKEETENPMPLHWAEWEGDDVIDNVYVYIFDGAEENATYETTKVLAGSEFEKNGDGDYTLKEPFLSTVGSKRVFVLVNLNQRLVDKINAKATTGCTAKEFRDFLQTSGWSNESISTVPTSTVTQTRADEFVKNVGGKDAIVMTGEPVEVEITEQMKETVKNTTVNTATASVERVVAKVLVTIDNKLRLKETNLQTVRNKAQGTDENADGYKSACMNFVDVEADDSPKAYISDITWAVVQGASDLYFLKKTSEDTEEFHYNAQNHETLKMEETTVKGQQLKNGSDDWTPNDFWNEVVPRYAEFSDYYDYSGLWKKVGDSTIPYGIDIQPTTPYVTGEDGEAKTETNHLKTDAIGKHSEYLFPTYVGSDAEQQRGNTAYILIRARVHPLKYKKGSSSEMVGADDEGFQDLSTFYFDPIKNLFGDSRAALVEDNDYPEAIMKYKDGYVYYFLLPNATKPTDKNTAEASPILRNQFYHIQINKVTDMGYPWNSLVPYPKGTQGGADPIIVNPQNPNPRPEDDDLGEDAGEDAAKPKQTGIQPNTKIDKWLNRYNLYDSGNEEDRDEYLEKFTRSSRQFRTYQSRTFGQGLNVTISPRRK